MLGIRVIQCRPRDPEAKGLVERANGYFETSFLPGRSFSSPADFNTQLASWLVRANDRQHRALGCRPSDASTPTSRRCWRCRRSTRSSGGGCRCGCRVITTSAWTATTTPSTRRAVGRRVEVIADLETVTRPLRRPAGRRTRALLGQASEHHRPRAPRRRRRLREPPTEQRVGRRRSTTGRAAPLTDYDTASASMTRPSRRGGGLMPAKTTPRARAGPHQRDRVPDPGVEGTDAARRGRPARPTGPRASPGRTRSSWSPACNARSPPGSPTAARAASAPPASPPARAWRTSTSTTPAASNAT